MRCIRVRCVFPAICLLLGQSATAQIRIFNVTEATSTSVPGLPAYGSIATISCAGLSGINGNIQAVQYPLPYELAGVSVRVEDHAAPLLAIADIGGGTQQITFQMPIDRTALTVPVVVSQSGQNAQTAVVPDLAWRFFLTLPSTAPYFAAAGTALVQHADYSPVTFDHPAQPGEVVVVYGTNLASLRETSNPPALGFPSPSSPLSVVPPVVVSGLSGRYTIWINGKEPEVQFIGLTPSQVGVFQVNFRVPRDTPDGDAILLAVSATCSYPEHDCVYAPSISARMPVRAALP
jgi:uncharacterized protein (TIGR03437 family)